MTPTSGRSPRWLRPVALAWTLGAAAGCGAMVGPPDDAVAPDVPPTDGLDATFDATLGDTVDAPAETGLDALPPADAPVACSVAGMRGECISVAACTGDRMATAGLCPGPRDIQCCTARRPDGGGGDVPPVPTDGWSCDPAAMPLPNTDLTEEPGAGGCRPGMLRVAAFCVDRFEAALALVASDGSLAPWSPYWNPGTRRVRALSLRGAVPQGYITGVQAADACREAGKRLCTDTEWLRACRGPAGTVYPYGDTRMNGVCNDARSIHPAVQYFGTSASWIYSMLGNACISQLPDSLDRTGDNPGCVTAEGAFDMMGNLHEWTSDPAGTFRGGYYVDTRINGEGCLYRTTAHDMTHWDYSTGFRCCADP